MGWDYNQYMSQPESIIEAIEIRMQEEASASARKSRMSQASSRRRTT